MTIWSRKKGYLTFGKKGVHCSWKSPSALFSAERINVKREKQCEDLKEILSRSCSAISTWQYVKSACSAENIGCVAKRVDILFSAQYWARVLNRQGFSPTVARTRAKSSAFHQYEDNHWSWFFLLSWITSWVHDSPLSFFLHFPFLGLAWYGS